MTPTPPDNAESGDAEGDREPPRPFHLVSYAHLLRTVPHPPGTGTEGDARIDRRPHAGVAIDAIIVPTIRHADQLHPAVQLAKQLRCQLIVLYTNHFPDGLPDVLAGVKPGRATALTVRADAGHALLDMGSAIPQSRVSTSALDISRKRNLGLLLGRSCGWTRVLFLDDDIRELSAEEVNWAAAHLSQYPVVGLQITGFPDDSVVGHARRITGRGRKRFISGGSMLVDPQRIRGFFPPVYHEDWLCIMDHLRRGEVAIAGSVEQLGYQPFTTETRAQLEEFGDILALGLLWLVHAKRDSSADVRVYWHEATKQQFWSDILRQRATLLDDLSRRLELNYPDDPESLPLRSIRSAQQRCDELSPGEFVSFVEEWLDSLITWQTLLSGLPRAHSVTKALVGLGFRDVVTMHHKRRPWVRVALAGSLILEYLRAGRS